VPKGEQAAENKAAAPGLNDSKTKDIPK
jgi:hypothetical protein